MVLGSGVPRVRATKGLQDKRRASERGQISHKTKHAQIEVDFTRMRQHNSNLLIASPCGLPAAQLRPFPPAHTTGCALSAVRERTLSSSKSAPNRLRPRVSPVHRRLALGRRRSSESIVSKDSLSHGGSFLIRGCLLQASLVSRVGRPRFQGVLVRRAMPSSSLLAARPATQSSPCLLGRPSMRPSQIIRVHGNGRSFVSLYLDLRRAPRWLDERLRLSARTHKNPSGSRLLSSSLLHLLPLDF